MKVAAQAETARGRALGYVLNAIATIAAIAGAVILVAPGWTLGFAPDLASDAAARAVGFLYRTIALFAFSFGYLAWLAGRDPSRYRGIVYLLIAFLLAFAALNIYAAATGGFDPFVAPEYLWGRAAGQIVVAAVLFALRPRVPAR